MKSDKVVSSTMEDRSKAGKRPATGPKFFGKASEKTVKKRSRYLLKKGEKRHNVLSKAKRSEKSDIHKNFWGNPKLRVDDWMAGRSGSEKGQFPHLLKSEISTLSEEAWEDLAASNIVIERYARDADEDSQIAQMYWTEVGMGFDDANALIMGRF